MTITAKITDPEDLDIDGDCEVELFCNGILVGTLTVYNPQSGKSFVGYTDELNRIDYNLLEVSETGAIINDKPIRD